MVVELCMLALALVSFAEVTNCHGVTSKHFCSLHMSVVAVVILRLVARLDTESRPIRHTSSVALTWRGENCG